MPPERICLICRLGYSFRYETLEYVLGEGEVITTNYAALPTYLYLKKLGEDPDLVVLAVDIPSIEGFEIRPPTEDVEKFLEEYAERVKELGKGREMPEGVLEFARMLKEEGVEIEILKMRSPREETGPEDKYIEWKEIVNELRRKLRLEEGNKWRIYLDLTHGFRPLSDLLWEAVRYLRVSYYESILKVKMIYEFWSLISDKCYPKELEGFEKCRELVESARYMIKYGIMSKELLREIGLEGDHEKALASFYEDLRMCDAVGVLRGVKKLRKALEKFPEDPPAYEIKRMIEEEFSDLLSLQDPDPTILRPEALLGLSLLINWYLGKENLLAASITSFEALRYGFSLLYALKKGNLGKNLKGRGALQRLLEKSGLLLNAVGRGGSKEDIRSVWRG